MREAVTKARAACERREREAGGVRDVHADVWARRDALLTREARAGRHEPHFAHLGREVLREAVTKARAACERRGREAGGVWDVHGDVWARRDMLLTGEARAGRHGPDFAHTLGGKI